RRSDNLRNPPGGREAHGGTRPEPDGPPPFAWRPAVNERQSHPHVQPAARMKGKFPDVWRPAPGPGWSSSAAEDIGPRFGATAGRVPAPRLTSCTGLRRDNGHLFVQSTRLICLFEPVSSPSSLLDRTRRR